MISPDTLSTIMNMNLEQLYKLFTVLVLEHDDLKDIAPTIRYDGINIPFDIYDVWESHIMKTKTGIALVNNQTYRIEDYRTEVEQRRALILRAIIEHAEDIDLTIGRMEVSHGSK